MKRTITVLILLVSLSGFAQRGGKMMHERIKSQKIAFITERLNLTSEEAEKFWPIYNEIEEKKHELREKSSLKKIGKRPADMTEAEADILLQEMLKMKDERHALDKELISKLSDVISSKKIIALMRAEREFDKKLIERLKQRREKRKGKK
ncbi:MAG: hypothetical protein Wins2KO_16010 [Winogradskyella sp.]